MKPHQCTTLVALWIGLWATSVQSQTDPEALARRIIQTLDHPIGLVHLPRCEEADLALALIGQDRAMRLHGQVESFEALQTLRRKLAARGLLGRRVWLDEGNLRHLGVAGRSADVIVIHDLEPAELTPALAGEIRRVLHPWFGAAVVGNTAGGLDKHDLKEWAASISPDAKALTAAGKMMLVRAGP
jgi:hypothetical protein